MKAQATVSAISNNQKPTPTLPDKAVKTLANSIFKQLRSEGCQTNDIISVSSHLISLITDEIKSADPQEKA
jgi:cytochrome c-type biogenesis protein CcmH/NrfF